MTTDADPPRPTADYHRIITLGYPGGLNTRGEVCPDCGAPAELVACAACGREGWVIYCAHYAQPRPIAPYGHTPDRQDYCYDCADAGVRVLEGLFP
jgi:hypothetical protein